MAFCVSVGNLMRPWVISTWHKLNALPNGIRQ
jgi:hypothetical protein